MGYYCFFSLKDEAVLACAEETAVRWERALIVPAIVVLDNLDKMMSNLKVRADEVAPTMRFLATVCTNKKYMQSVSPVLERLDERNDEYAEKIAYKLDGDKSEVEPYVDMLITSVSHYMVFAEDVFAALLMKIAGEKFSELITKKLQSKGV